MRKSEHVPNGRSIVTEREDVVSPPRCVAVIQARMGSSRLPGKILKDIAGEPMLSWVVIRARAIAGIDDVVVATTNRPEDDLVIELCEERGWTSFRGDAVDVLDRHVQAARRAGAEHVMRITSDCPLVCVTEGQRVLRRHLDAGADFTHNLPQWGGGMPLGTAVEVFSIAALERTWRESSAPYHREHVDEYLADHRSSFDFLTVPAPDDLFFPDVRLTVDTKADLDLIRAIYGTFDDKVGISVRDVVQRLSSGQVPVSDQ
jgi:spore coat polysaccharide biosynthesis protein SpsF